jgi:hypothetical protein
MLGSSADRRAKGCDCGRSNMFVSLEVEEFPEERLFLLSAMAVRRPVATDVIVISPVKTLISADFARPR